MEKRYIVNLTKDEREQLDNIVSRERVAALKRERALILLLADEGWTEARRIDFPAARKLLLVIDLAADGPRVTITLEADGFLYKMVRNVVRAVVKVGIALDGV